MWQFEPEVFWSCSNAAYAVWDPAFRKSRLLKKRLSSLSKLSVNGKWQIDEKRKREVIWQISLISNKSLILNPFYLVMGIYNCFSSPDPIYHLKPSEIFFPLCFFSPLPSLAYHALLCTSMHSFNVWTICVFGTRLPISWCSWGKGMYSPGFLQPL